MLSYYVGVVCLCWYIAFPFACALGYIQIYRHYRTRPAKPLIEELPSDYVPHVTIIRAVKGLEPELYRCLASTFHQTYPSSKLTVYFCVSDRDDPAIPVIRQLLADHSGYDACLFIEDEDHDVDPTSYKDLGPNPKVRNWSRAYREAKGDVIWLIDCNVWVGKGVAGRMADALHGYSSGKPFKFVHQLPLVVDMTHQRDGLLGHDMRDLAATTSTTAYETVSSASSDRQTDSRGSALEETFLTSAHAKWYTAINTVSLAPCILGKSNMFRRSHLNALTEGKGTDYFSHNICEDHLIGDLLWKKPVPDIVRAAEAQRMANVPNAATTINVDWGTVNWGNHKLCRGDLAIQPIAHMALSEYFARRVRWLRVRKFTVTLATLVEPGTEYLHAALIGAYALTTFPWFEQTLDIPPTWTAFAIIWLTNVVIGCAADWALYKILMGMGSIEVDSETPRWARGTYRRRFGDWIRGWLAREALAMPIWIVAVWGGVTVAWRGRRFKVGLDARVTPLDPPVEVRPAHPGTPRMNGNGHAKSRRE